jgi:hypothetical protein
MVALRLLSDTCDSELLAREAMMARTSSCALTSPRCRKTSPAALSAEFFAASAKLRRCGRFASSNNFSSSKVLYMSESSIAVSEGVDCCQIIIWSVSVHSYNAQGQTYQIPQTLDFCLENVSLRTKRTKFSCQFRICLCARRITFILFCLQRLIMTVDSGLNLLCEFSKRPG